MAFAVVACAGFAGCSSTASDGDDGDDDDGEHWHCDAEAVGDGYCVCYDDRVVPDPMPNVPVNECSPRLFGVPGICCTGPERCACWSYGCSSSEECSCGLSAIPGDVLSCTGEVCCVRRDSEFGSCRCGASVVCSPDEEQVASCSAAVIECEPGYTRVESCP